MQVFRIIVILSLITTAAFGGELVLVENSKAIATIVLAENPSRSARFAAQELNLHLEKITGVKLPVVNGNHEVKGVRILVGESSATLKLNLKNSDFKTQEYLIRFLPDTLVLMGRDMKNVAPKAGAKLPAQNSPPTFRGTEEMGTCYAVYDFLERCCDVRWYGPGEIGMVYPTMKTLRVGGKDVRRAPGFLWRSAWPFPAYAPKGLCANLWGRPKAKDVQNFGRRMRFGGEKYRCSHSFEGYYARFWKKNPKKPNVFEKKRPQYFAKGYESETQPPQPCFTNPDLVQQVIRDARDYFDRGVRYDRAFPTGDYFPICPQDNNRYCKCPACTALDDKDKKEVANRFFMNGRWSNYHFQFVNKVAKAIKKSHPGKYISALAYWDYAYHPSNVKLEPNISIQFCLDNRQWAYPHNKRNDLFFYRDWLAKEPGRRFYVWSYYCFPELSTRSGQFNCFPCVIPHSTARNIKMFHRDGIRGVYFGVPCEQLDLYVTLKMLDDPTLDVDVLLNEFFARYYGPAGDAMKRIYQKIEEIYSTTSNYPESVITGERITHQTEEIAWAYLGTEGRMADLGKLMAKAKASASTDMEKKRVGLFENAIWNYMVEGRKKYLRKKNLAGFVEKLKKAPLPTARIPRAKADYGGDPDKVNFSTGAIAGPWYTMMGYPAERKVEARVLHDGNYLYIQLYELRGLLNSDKLTNHANVWKSDVWELFFAAKRQKPYRQLGINPAGKIAALQYGETPISGDVWDSGARVRSYQSDGQWTVRVAIPLAKLLPGGVKPGATFYANLIRSPRDSKPPLAWSPHFKRSHHVPDRMGKIVLE